MNEHVIDAEAIEETSTELTVAAPTPPTLFRTDDPVEVLARATETANALAPVIRAQGLAVTIQGKQHVTVEGWQSLGAMLGVTPVTVWTRQIEGGWEARCEARTLDGRVIGAAEAECLRAERRWAKADDYAVRSMAQTRATSKALSSVLRFIVTLAGFSGTPAEEMPREAPQAHIEPVQAPQPEEPTIDAETAAGLVARAWKVPAAKENFRLAIQHKLGSDPGDTSTKPKATKAAELLTLSQAEAVDTWIARKEAENA